MIHLAWAILLAPTATAQDEVPDGRTYKYQERTEIEFDKELEIGGELVGPRIDLVSGPPRAQFNPLIRLRATWNQEMKASIDEIR